MKLKPTIIITNKLQVENYLKLSGALELAVKIPVSLLLEV
jgi:hypothetical protein